MALLTEFASTDPDGATELADQIERDWVGAYGNAQARDKQIEPPGEWFVWLLQTGRGWGKNRTASETVRARIDRGIWRAVLCAGPTWTDVMDTMVKGSAAAPGLLSLWPPSQRPVLRMSQEDPHLECWNGAKIRLRTAQKPERFRGTNNDGAWLDELDSWKPEAMTATEAFGVAEFTVRTGDDPRIICTSTPKRGRLVAELRKRDDVHLTTGSLYENQANLHPAFVRAVANRYAGTRFGRQEIEGELLEDVEGAIVSLEMIDATRVDEAPDLTRIVVGVDPSGGKAEQGIVAVGKGADGDAYVLADATCLLRPEGWGRRVVETADRWGADCIVAERNFGGDMVESTIQTVSPRARVKLPTASRGKHVRFEPVGALYEQGRVHHVGSFDKLEDEICGFTPEGYDGDESPNRADALVWAMTELVLSPPRGVTPDDLYGREGCLVVA